MWRRVALVRTDVSEEHIASIIRVEHNQPARSNASSNYQLNHHMKKYELYQKRERHSSLILSTSFTVTAVQTSNVNGRVEFPVQFLLFMFHCSVLFSILPLF
jgi:hypothetical protein